MAKTSSIEKNNRRRRLTKKFAGKRGAAQGDRQRQAASRWRSASRPRSSLRRCRATASATRIRNRCEVTGRPRAYYRKLKMSRIALRDLGSKGLIPGHGQVELVRSGRR